MRWWVVVVAVAFCHGCLRDDLVRCGDRYCPATSTCMAGRCISPQQLAACDGVAEGAGCVVLDTAGTCVAGLCEIAGRCGDAFVDVGEICDDGNQTDGDGCSRTCASDETCGNGVLDLDETCDCGTDAATQPLGCPTNNDDDLTALCDTSCSRVCGDDQATGLEACDGTDVPATCEDFGFYTGTVTCSPFCSFVRECSGRCGDGMLQNDFGEVCDGDATVTDTCVEFGRDFGSLGCNQFCNPDVGGDCSFYSWTTIAASTVVIDAQANAQGTIVNAGGVIEVMRNGTVFATPRSASTRVHATAASLLTSEDSGGALKLERLDGTTWTQVAATLTVGGAGYFAQGDGDLLYVLDAESCRVSVIDPVADTTTTLPTPPITGCTSFDVLDRKVVIAATEVYWLDAPSWRKVPSLSATHVRWYGTERIATLAAGIRQVVDILTGQPVAAPTLGGVTGIATTRGGNDIVTLTGGAMLGHVGYLTAYPANTIDASKVARDGAGHVIAWGDKLVLRLRAAWSVLDFPRGFSEQPDGRIVEFDTTTVDETSWPGGFGTPTSVAGEPGKVHWVASSTGLYIYSTGSNSYSLDSGLTGSAKVVRSSAATWALVAGMPYHYSGASWDTKGIPPGCTSAIDLAAANARVVVLFVCPNTFGSRRVYELQNDTWVQLGPLVTGDKIVMAREDEAIFVVASTAFRRLDNNAWTGVSGALHVDSFTARSAMDVYYQRLQDNSLYHWDGKVETPFRGMSPLSTITLQALALDAGLYIKTNNGNGVLGFWGPTPAGL